MALTSSSTVTDAENQYKNNLNWEGDRAKALLALEAVRFLLIARPREVVGEDGRSHRYEELLEEKNKLEDFVSRSTTAARCTFTRGRALVT